MSAVYVWEVQSDRCGLGEVLRSSMLSSCSQTIKSQSVSQSVPHAGSSLATSPSPYIIHPFPFYNTSNYSAPAVSPSTAHTRVTFPPYHRDLTEIGHLRGDGFFYFSFFSYCFLSLSLSLSLSPFLYLSSMRKERKSSQARWKMMVWHRV